MDLAGNMDLAEDFTKYILKYVLDNNQDDLEFLEKRLLDEEKTKPQDERSEMTLIEKIKFVVDNHFKRVSYTEAIDILRDSKPNKKKKFNYLIDQWGADLQSEHERFLVEKHFKCPVILFDYPANIKAFYRITSYNVCYTKLLRKGLKLMDTTAFTLSQENELPIIVFDMNKKGNLLKVVSGENIGTKVKL